MPAIYLKLMESNEAKESIKPVKPLDNLKAALFHNPRIWQTAIAVVVMALVMVSISDLTFIFAAYYVR